MQLLWHRAPRSGDRSGLSTAHTHTKCQDSRMVTEIVPTHPTQNRPKLLKQKRSSPSRTFQDTRAAALHHLHCHNGYTTHQSEYQLMSLPFSPKPMENKGLSTNWEDVWMSCLIHSSQRKSSSKLLKQSVAWKKQLRYNWNHHPAQKPSGKPPHTPWCQQVYMKADDSSLGNKDC